MPPESTPIDAKPVLRMLTRLAEQVMPDAEDLEKIGKVGYAYFGAGLFHIDTDWSVDRQGHLKVGGGGDVDADLRELLKGLAAGQPAGAVSGRIQSALDRLSAQEGKGKTGLFFLPMVGPKEEVRMFAAAVTEAFTKIASHYVKSGGGSHGSGVDDGGVA